MALPGSAVLRDLTLWLNASIAEAEELLPDVLALPADILRRDIEERPELRTAGVMSLLIHTARLVIPSYPDRALELTSIAVEHVAAIPHPAAGAVIARRIEAQAWREHANALRAMQNPEEAFRAIAVARDLFEQMPGGEWHLATVDLVEAEILCDLGERRAALASVRRAAEEFAHHGDRKRYFDAQFSGASMLCAEGDAAGAAAAWLQIAETARQRGDSALMARLASSLGSFELLNGAAGEARRLFAAAVDGFESAELRHETVRARWNLAEAAAARGSTKEAISEYFKVRAELLDLGDVVDAAVVSAEILDLLLLAGRADEVPPFTETLVTSFRDAGMTANALRAFQYLRKRAAAGLFTYDDVIAVRRYLEELFYRPNASFVAPA